MMKLKVIFLKYLLKNTAHHYSYTHDTPVELEMHWSHDEDFILDKRDTQTIVQQMKFIHDQYYQSERVDLTHVFKTTLFDYSIQTIIHKTIQKRIGGF